MLRVENVAVKGETKMHIEFWLGNVPERDHL